MDSKRQRQLDDIAADLKGVRRRVHELHDKLRKAELLGEHGEIDYLMRDSIEYVHYHIDCLARGVEQAGGRP
jgi:hypothetical protein